MRGSCCAVDWRTIARRHGRQVGWGRRLRRGAARLRRRRGWRRTQLDRAVLVERSRVRVRRRGAEDEAVTAAVELRVLLQEVRQALVLLQGGDQLRLRAENDGLLSGQLEHEDRDDLNPTGCGGGRRRLGRVLPRLATA